MDTFRETNYDQALGFGFGTLKDAAKTQYKSYKQAKIWVPEKPAPIKLNPDYENCLVELCDLPLVSPMGSFASQRKWDQLGAIKIAAQKVKRFDAMSYLGEKAHELDTLTPLPIVETSLTKFERQSCHIFSMLAKPIEPIFLEDRKVLYKNIIKGKRRVSELARVLKHHNKL